jgi:hypothetical protein
MSHIIASVQFFFFFSLFSRFLISLTLSFILWSDFENVGQYVYIGHQTCLTPLLITLWINCFWLDLVLQIGNINYKQIWISAQFGQHCPAAAATAEGCLVIGRSRVRFLAKRL